LKNNKNCPLSKIGSFFGIMNELAVKHETLYL